MTAGVAKTYTVNGLAGNTGYFARFVVSNDLESVTVVPLAGGVATLEEPFVCARPAYAVDEEGNATVTFDVEAYYAAAAGTVTLYIGTSPGGEFVQDGAAQSVSAAGQKTFPVSLPASGDTACVKVVVTADGVTKSYVSGMIPFWIANAETNPTLISNAVYDISFKVKKGEIVGFLGPNGAGKSTTMNILTGYLSSTAGRVAVDGIDVLGDPLGAKKLIGYLPEQPPLYLDMTVDEYLGFNYDLKHCSLPREQHLAEICETVRIGDVRKRVIRNLSKGYRQRVGIAGALVGNPKVIIFDEPTVGLDPKQIIEIRNLIRTLGKDHTVILSTHILQEVQAVCDRVIVLNNGKIVADSLDKP